jgi:hypothetical protein
MQNTQDIEFCFQGSKGGLGKKICVRGPTKKKIWRYQLGCWFTLFRPRHSSPFLAELIELQEMLCSKVTIRWKGPYPDFRAVRTIWGFPAYTLLRIGWGARWGAEGVGTWMSIVNQCIRVLLITRALAKLFFLLSHGTVLRLSWSFPRRQLPSASVLLSLGPLNVFASGATASSLRLHFL